MLSTDDENSPRRKWDPHAPPFSVKPDTNNSELWLKALPPPWCDNPRVVILMVPRDAAFRIRKATTSEFKGAECVFVEFKRGEEEWNVPMQLIDRDYGNWVQQKKVVEAMTGKMHPVAFNGHLADITPRCTMNDTMMPIVVLWDTPHKQPLHLTEALNNFTKRSGING